MFEDIARDRRRERLERNFLERYIFSELRRLQINFDAPGIAHFRSEDFLRVLDRCDRFGVAVHGVEVFTYKGEMLVVELSKSGSASSFFSLVVRFCGREYISICASYGVPDALLTSPAVCEDLITAYKRSEYTISLPNQRVTVRIGERCPGLQKLMRDSDVHEGYFVTACNPFSSGQRGFDEVQNDLLRLELERAAAKYYACIAAEGTDWEEAGFFAVGLSFEDVERLGVDFGQNAIVGVTADGEAHLRLLR